MVYSSNLGFPRMGAQRELKKLVENFWAAKVSEKELLNGSKRLREENWRLQQQLDVVPSNDFSFYDQILDAAWLVGAVPDRYRKLGLSSLETYFAMGRGLQRPARESAPKVDVPAQEMKKWFDTNYHFIVPEFTPGQSFRLASPVKPVEEFKEAKELGILTRPVLIGPVTFLALGKPEKNAPALFRPLSLLENLLPVYEQLLRALAEEGAEWVQIDEPLLMLDLDAEAAQAFPRAYERLQRAAPSLRLLLATYFERIEDNLKIIQALPVHGLHVDLVRAPSQLEAIVAAIARKPDFVLSLGVINGRNIWKANFARALDLLDLAVDKLGSERVLVAPSCSLLHTPHGLSAENKLDAELLDWLAFASEKISELVLLARAVNRGRDSVTSELAVNEKSFQARKNSQRITNAAVQQELSKVDDSMMKRESPFVVRRQVQQEKLNLPDYPTTTVGSFPQTKEVRVARANWKKGTISQEEYDDFINKETARCVKLQEQWGLDVLVHGEFERNDMVEFFGESLQGYCFTANGWVQSYGSRCVKPPIIYGDISRLKPMTVKMSQYAQTLTKKPMKGMLTGPITLLQWSFVRDDQPRKLTAYQLALAVRQEVKDLEVAGIPCIQIDEPAIREGLPLRHSDWDEYLKWAVDAFLLSSTGVSDATQIHSHMCYSDFNDIFDAIVRMDADALTIENSKSDLKLLSVFEKRGYPNGIGPGLYDIHSPRVPPVEEMKDRFVAYIKAIGRENLWCNPDCGLKTRGWTEVEAALRNMCAVAKEFRNNVGR